MYISIKNFIKTILNSRKLSHKLEELKKMIQDAVVSRVVEDFVDINTPLKQFTDAVHVPKGNIK